MDEERQADAACLAVAALEATGSTLFVPPTSTFLGGKTLTADSPGLVSDLQELEATHPDPEEANLWTERMTELDRELQRNPADSKSIYAEIVDTTQSMLDAIQ